MDLDEGSLKKCGEIYSFHHKNYKDFLLKCTICEEKFFSLQKFSNHYEGHHLDNLLTNDSGSQVLPNANVNVKSGNIFGTSNNKDEEIGLRSIVKEEVELSDLNDSDQEFLDEFHMNEEFLSNPVLIASNGCVNGLNTTNNNEDSECFAFGREECLVVEESIDSSKRRNPEQIISQSFKKPKIQDVGNVVNESSSPPKTCFPCNESGPTEVARKGFLKILEENKDLVSFLIEAIKNEPLIWDGEHPQRSDYKKKRKIFKEIVNLVYEKKSYYITVEDIKELLRFFRTVRQASATFPNRPGGEIWFLNQLDFLKVPKTRKRENLSTARMLNSEPALPIADFTDEENIRLIEIYKRFKGLWDTDSLEFRLKDFREKALKEMHEALVKVFPLKRSNIDTEILIYQIRLACSQEKCRQYHAEKMNDHYESKCKFVKYLEFLYDFVGPFKCSYCSEIITGIDTFKMHKAEHDRSVPFSCSICKKGFFKPATLVVHLKRHMMNSLECKQCGERFLNKKDLHSHEQRSHIKRNICDSNAPGISNKTVILNAHKEVVLTKKRIKCNVCNETFSDNFQMEFHMKKFHAAISDKVCDICGKIFPTIIQMRQHKRSHETWKSRIKKKLCISNVDCLLEK